MVLDNERLPRQRQNVVIAQRKPPLLGLADIHGQNSGIASFPANELGRLYTEIPSHDRVMAGPERWLIDIELVGVHGPFDDGLAQAVGRGDQHQVAKTGLRIERKHHTGATEIVDHHALYGDGHRDA